jgi:hypothetical protein
MTMRSTGAWGWLTTIQYAQPDEALLWRSYVPAVSQPRGVSELEPDFTTAHRPTDGAENPQNHTNDYENAANCVQDAEAWNEISDDDQNDSENYHDDSISGIQIGFAVIGVSTSGVCRGLGDQRNRAPTTQHR